MALLAYWASCSGKTLPVLCELRLKPPGISILRIFEWSTQQNKYEFDLKVALWPGKTNLLFVVEIHHLFLL